MTGGDAGPQQSEPPASGRQRIDRWLFFARVVKSRSLAAKLAVSGRVRINSQKTDQPSAMVRTGDVLTITLDRQVLVWRVLGSGTRRGPAPEACLLYEDLSPKPVPGAASPEAAPASRDHGSGRPTKRERRQTDRLRDLW